MAHFYGMLKGSRVQATRSANRFDGITSWMQTATSRITVKLAHGQLDTGEAGNGCRITLGPGRDSSGGEVDLTGTFEPDRIWQAAQFDLPTRRHIKAARLAIQRANQSAFDALATHDTSEAA
jgi:hypothetical protein